MASFPVTVNPPNNNIIEIHELHSLPRASRYDQQIKLRWFKHTLKRCLRKTMLMKYSIFLPSSYRWHSSIWTSPWVLGSMCVSLGTGEEECGTPTWEASWKLRGRTWQAATTSVPEERLSWARNRWVIHGLALKTTSWAENCSHNSRDES